MDITVTLIIQGLAFFAVAWVVMKYLWPPIVGAIEARQQKIAAGLAAADRGQKDLEQAKVRGEEIIREARERANKIVDQAGKRSNEMVAEAKSTAEGEAARVVSHARGEIASETARVRDQLREQVASLAARGATQILKREIDAKAHAALLDELAAEIGERG
jgi:F-type H+-transporting ATPase subunit b